jgi:hypothetical protein
MGGEAGILVRFDVFAAERCAGVARPRRGAARVWLAELGIVLLLVARAPAGAFGSLLGEHLLCKR